MAVCRWGCVWQMSPGARWSRVSGAREGMCESGPWRRLNQCRCAGRSRLRCCMHAERRIESWCRTEVPWETVCVWVWFILFEAGLVLSTQMHWSVGGIFFNMQRGTGNYLVLWAVYIDSCSAAFSGEILHMPAPYTVTLKEKVFLFYLFARS